MKKFLSIPTVQPITSFGNQSTAVAPFKLIDSGNPFITAGVQVGDNVVNLIDTTTATVTAVDSASQLSLSDDIFTATGLDYIVSRRNSGRPNGLVSIDLMLYIKSIVANDIPNTVTVAFAGFNKGASAQITYVTPPVTSGTNTGFGIRTITDSTADFIAAGVKPGDTVYGDGPLTVSETSSVVSVDSATQLTLERTLYDATGQNYHIYKPEVVRMNDFIQNSVLKLMSSKWTENVLELKLDDFPLNVIESTYT